MDNVGGLVCIFATLALLAMAAGGYVVSSLVWIWAILVSWTQDARFIFGDSMQWGSDIRYTPPIDYYAVNTKIDKIEKLSKEVVKFFYTRDVLNNPNLDDEQFKKKMERLIKMEKANPNFKGMHSPTGYESSTDRIRYREKMGRETYGAKGWENIKRTLDLLKPVTDFGLEDY